MAAQEQDWTYWRQTLAGESTTYSDARPQSGFYRIKRRRLDGGGWADPVAIWKSGDLWKAKRGSETVRANEVWILCAPHAVAHAAYKRAIEGGGWEDQIEARESPSTPPSTQQAAPKEQPVQSGPGEREVAGDNSSKMGVEVLLAELIAQKIADFRKWKENAGEAHRWTQAQSDHAGAFKEAIARERLEANKKYRAEKDPYVALGKAIDAKWTSIISAANRAEKEIVDATAPFLIEQRRLENVRIAAAQKAEAEERARIVAEDAAKAASGPQTALGRPSEPTLSPPPGPAPYVGSTATFKAGSSGRGITLKTIKIAVVEDIAALLAFYIRRPECEIEARAWAEKFAPTSVAPIPGVKIIEKDVAK
jgi:hypothetical protein